MSSDLIQLLTQSRRPRILVVGDVMLDGYVWGEVDRISPEAPIPVLRVDRREERLGGAGSVATMLAALEVDVTLAAVTGDDPEGRQVAELLGQLGVAAQCVLSQSGRPTTVKQRLLGRTQNRHPHQMVRIDRETTRPIGAQLARRLLRAIGDHLDQVDLVLVSDYDKGVCAGGLVGELVRLARAAGVRVVADPVRDADYNRYAGCTCITPNRTEAAGALGRSIATADEALEAARQLLNFGVEAAVVTLDSDGIAWAEAKGRSRLFPVRPQQVYDVTGAGDMVLSALGYALAAGADWPAAVELANLAGGLEVRRLGVVPLGREELLEELAGSGTLANQKILDIDRLAVQLSGRRKAGQRIAMTNGCFDLLHPGHVASLEAARRYGDLLVVGLNSDRSIEQIKGPGRPIVDQQGRAAMLAALGCVDYVVIFDEPSVAGLVRRVLPDVLVKSSQYAVEEVVGHEIVEQGGGRVVLAPFKSEYSTSTVIEKIQSMASHPSVLSSSIEEWPKSSRKAG